MTQLLFYGLIAGLFSLVGGLLLIWRADFAKKIITTLLSFAAGAFMGVAFLDVLPEAVELVDEPHNVFIAFLAGFTVFFLLERALMKYRRHDGKGESDHDHHEHTESLPALVITGDATHNFLDGVLIALAYSANPSLGLATALAIAAHEIPQEIGDFTILLDQGWSKAKIIWMNIVVSLVTIPGILIGYFAASFFESKIAYLLAAAAGIFAYIAASDLIPEIHHRAGHRHVYKISAAFIIGLIAIGYLVTLAH